MRQVWRRPSSRSIVTVEPNCTWSGLSGARHQLRGRAPRGPVAQIAPDARERGAIAGRLRARVLGVQARERFLDLREAFAASPDWDAREIGRSGRSSKASPPSGSLTNARLMRQGKPRCGPFVPRWHVNPQFMSRRPTCARFDSEASNEGLTMIRKFAYRLGSRFHREPDRPDRRGQPGGRRQDLHLHELRQEEGLQVLKQR